MKSKLLLVLDYGSLIAGVLLVRAGYKALGIALMCVGVGVFILRILLARKAGKLKL